MPPVWVRSRRSRPCFSLGVSSESPVGAGWLRQWADEGQGLCLGQTDTLSCPAHHHRDVAQAADVAIEHRNEAELSLVLSHCTGATDGATADKIQRARAQAQKK